MFFISHNRLAMYVWVSLRPPRRFRPVARLSPLYHIVRSHTCFQEVPSIALRIPVSYQRAKVLSAVLSSASDAL